jgi:hypothetical protein
MVRAIRGVRDAEPMSFHSISGIVFRCFCIDWTANDAHSPSPDAAGCAEANLAGLP